MRESLTVLAMLLIVVLTAALVGPYFVDWNAHRGEIEKRLSGLLGADVAVTGPIDVKLLPRPIFRLQDVSVSGRSPRQGTAAAARVDMELSLTALLRGEILFVDADITAPRVTLPLGPDRSILLPQLSDDTADRISLVHLALREGMLVLVDPDGAAAFTAGGIAGEGEADSLAGPFKFTGQVDTPRGPLGLRVATGAIETGRMRLKVGVDASGGLPKTDVDGMVTTAPGPAGGAGLNFDGALMAIGSVAATDATGAIPWRLAATLHAEPGRAELKNGELRAGADGRALIASLAGDIDLGTTPAARLTLHARQADLGRLAVPATTADGTVGATPVPLADSLAALAALAGDADLTSGLPLPLALDYRIDTIVAGSLTLGDLSGHVTAAPGAPVSGTLAVAAADGSRIAFDGRFEPGPAAVFKGRIDASSAHVQRFADSLATDLPAVGAAIRQALPVDALTLSGSFDLSGIGFAAHDVALSLDRSRFAGTVTLTRAVGQDRARLFADLTSDALDLDALPDWRDTAAAATDLDVQFRLVARATRLASTDTGSLNAGRVALDLAKTGRVITVDRLSLADIGGATGEFKARSDGTNAHAEGRLDARRLNDLFTLLDRIAPGFVTDQLLARADVLSPALLNVAADATFAADGTPVPTLLTLEGTAAATAVTLHLQPNETPRAPAGGATPPFALTLSLDAPDTGALLRQFGLATAAANAVGRGRIEVVARRDPQGSTSGTLTAALGAVNVTAEGSGTLARSTTRLSVKGANVAQLARALLLANPEPGAIWPVEATATLAVEDRRLKASGLAGRLLGSTFSGSLAYAMPEPGAAAGASAPPALTGALTIDRLPLTGLAAIVLGPLPAPKAGALWPDAAFAPALVSLPRADLGLTVPTLPLLEGLVARDAKATLRLTPGALTLADLTAGLGQGRIGGSATLHRDGGAASLAAHVAWADLPVAGPSLGGSSQATLDIAGTGTSVGGIMASLAGSGTLGIAAARLPRFDPAAITHAIADSDAAPGTIDEAAIAAELGQDLDHGALSLGTVAIPVTVAAGVMRSDPVRVQAPLVQAEASGTLDLRSLLLSLKATATLLTPPKDWTGVAPQVGVIWKGPILSPARDVDASALVNGLAARAIARDQARIEAFQDDIRERAFFARRLKAIEAEQQAARDKAKADAEAERQRQQPSQPSPGPPNAEPGAGLVPTPPPRPMPMPPRRPARLPMDLHQ